MTDLSDISPAVEKMQICFFYVIGGISLVANSVTLRIIVRKSSALTREVKILTEFQQISCLLSNAFMTLLIVPFFYTRMGGGYCVGLLCLIIPYQYVMLFEVFLSMCMLSAFGIMIIARHQLLIMDGSILKMSAFVKYAVYFTMNALMQMMTVVILLSLPSDRQKQNEVLNWHKKYTWRERGLNWFLFYGPGSPALRDFSYYAFFVAAPLFCVLIVLPFAHMLHIVLRVRSKMHFRQRGRDVHIRHAQTIIIQCLVLLIFVGLPFIPAIYTTTLEDVDADTQTTVVIAEMVFVCATLLNSIVIVFRNRNYRAALSTMIRSISFFERHSVHAMNSVK